MYKRQDTVRADTRAKVEKVLKRCNYAPSAIAQGMVSKSLHTVAVLTVDIRDSHYARTAYTLSLIHISFTACTPAASCSW